MRAAQRIPPSSPRSASARGRAVRGSRGSVRPAVSCPGGGDGLLAVFDGGQDAFVVRLELTVGDGSGAAGQGVPLVGAGVLDGDVDEVVGQAGGAEVRSPVITPTWSVMALPGPAVT